MIRFIIFIIAIASVGLGTAIAFSGPGTRLGVWDFGTGLSLIRNLALPAMIAAGLSVLSIILSVWKERDLFLTALLGLIAAGAASAVPLMMKSTADSYPYIHDITTDFENPPAIIVAADLERKNPAAYVGDEPAPGQDGVTTAEAQMKAFPDIEPIIVDKDLETTTAAIRRVLESMKLETLAEGPVDGEIGSGWRVEAAATTFWYGFVDDFIVRVSPIDNGKTRIDVRSKSRVGISDLGANAKRIRLFSEKLKQEL